MASADFHFRELIDSVIVDSLFFIAPIVCKALVLVL